MVPFFLTCCAFLKCLTAEIGEEGIVDEIVNEALEAFNVPGAAIGLVVDGKTVFVRGYGMRDVEQKLPVTEKTLFPIGSCTKAFTSFLLAQLADEGILSLDDPVVTHLPEFLLSDPDLTAKVTIRDLLAHRTGLPRHDVLWHSLYDLSKIELMDLASHFKPVHGLREKFLYTNVTYTIAEALIEKVTGKSWEEEVFSRIFNPLGMKDSNMTRVKQSTLALPYSCINGTMEELPFHDLYPVAAAGGICSTALDMVKWVELQMAEETPLIRKKMLQEMHTSQIPFSVESKNEVTFGYGLGWCIGAYRGHSWIHHGGTFQGFRAEVSFLPQDKIGVVILTNSSTDGHYAVSYIRNRIYDQFFGMKDDSWMETIQKQRAAAQASIQRRDTPPLPCPSPLRKYEGSYYDEIFGTMKIAVERDQLYASLGNMHIPLIWKEGDCFEGAFSVLLRYGINPIAEFSFRAPDELHVPFEQFRGAPPTVFRRI